MKPFTLFTMLALAALACGCAAHAALDDNPANFRADPDAWIRTNVIPDCRSPGWLDVAPCNCMAKAIAPRISDADVMRAKEPGYIVAKVELASVMAFCAKALTPPPPRS